ncbi:MAG: GH3 auxin-responsive promoter family protein [Paracoccaceae bacterium]|nr:GH3 auxin-responsive promoter family protein [Paracoccaceae bacterium]
MNRSTPVTAKRATFADFSSVGHFLAKRRYRNLERQDAEYLQTRILRSLTRKARNTAFGRAHGFEGISNVADYQKAVPLRYYDDFWKDWWEARYPSLDNVSWPGRVPYFALSSGTTTGRSKHIPYTTDMRRAAARGFVDLLACHLINNPESRLMGGAILGLTGPTSLQSPSAGVNAGAVSAITAGAVPWPFRKRVLPSPELADLDDWREKIRRLAPSAAQTDLRMIGGSPNWLLVFFSEMNRQFRAKNGALADWFPNLELIVHGGVNFAPYRDRFRELMDGGHAETRELYSASEGVFAYADRGDGDGLRLHLNGSVFFEFIPVSELKSASPIRNWVGNVETGVDYALAVTTAAGLWSYLVGDVVRFVSTRPPRLLVAGRVNHDLSAFGEHLLESEIAEVLAKTAAAFGTHIAEYTVGAARHENGSHHRYLVETETPLSAEVENEFTSMLDALLRAANEDYQELRKDDLAVAPPKVTFVESGAFAAWMQSRRALGGQNKVPRIVTDKELFGDISGFLETFANEGRQT